MDTVTTAPNTNTAITANNINAWMGIDISKESFDACLKTASGYHRHRFVNQPAGYAALLAWQVRMAPGAVCHYGLESTGPYSQGLALYLVDHDRMVSILNPFRVRHAALAKGSGNKTDVADARLLADYCCSESPSVWRLAVPAVRELLALLRRLDEIARHRGQETNRLESTTLPKHVLLSVKNTIRFLDKETKRLERQVKDHIDRHPGLKEDVELLQSIPGIGEDTALRLLAEMPDVGCFASAKQAAAYAGLAPREHRSGTSVHRKTRLAKAGNAHLRKALFFPAMSAIRYNPLIRAFYQRLTDRGLCKMAALAACMRKLLMIAYGVLKHRQPFSVMGCPKAP